MAEGRNAADCEAGRLAYEAAVRPLEVLANQRGGERLVEPVVAGDEEKKSIAARLAEKNQRLDDLRDGAVTSRGRLFGGARRLRSDVNADVESERPRGVGD